MKHAWQIFLAVYLVGSALCAQEKSQQTLQAALLLENQGHYDAAEQMIEGIIDTGQLQAVELGRAYIMLGFAHREQGNFRQAESSFDQAIQILQPDPAAQGDYASALENYAGLYGDFGQFKPAVSLMQKALRLRLQAGNHAAAERCLLTLAEHALAGKRVPEAEKYVERAAEEMKLAPNLLSDDRMAFMETHALLEMREGHASAAVVGYTDALQLCMRTYGEKYWLNGWELVFRGKAYFDAGDPNSALADLEKGLDILEQSVGRKNPMYIASQIVYSQVLEKNGSLNEAARVRVAAEQARKDLYGGQCPGCTINVAGFR